jgi:Spy/CpxP family protein refolding chaperone
MRAKSILTLALFATLSGPFLHAQQPDGGSSPMSPESRMGKMGPGNGPGFDGRPGFRSSPMGMWWKNPDLVQKLGLTADQQKRMDDIFQQSRLQLIDLRANVEKQEVMMEPMLAANPPDTNKILAQIDQTAQARAELEKANARMLLGIRNVLTPDQWTKLQAERRSHRMRGGRNGMRPGQEGPGGPPDKLQGGPQGMLAPPPPAGGPNDFGLDAEAHLDAPDASHAQM